MARLGAAENSTKFPHTMLNRRLDVGGDDVKAKDFRAQAFE